VLQFSPAAKQFSSSSTLAEAAADHRRSPVNQLIPQTTAGDNNYLLLERGQKYPFFHPELIAEDGISLS